MRTSCSCLSFLSLSTRRSSLPSIFLAYPSMDTWLPSSLTPVERFGFLSSYLTITRTWAQEDSLPPQLADALIVFLLFLFPRSDIKIPFVGRREGRKSVVWIRCVLKKRFRRDFPRSSFLSDSCCASNLFSRIYDERSVNVTR